MTANPRCEKHNVELESLPVTVSCFLCDRERMGGLEASLEIEAQSSRLYSSIALRVKSGLEKIRADAHRGAISMSLDAHEFHEIEVLAEAALKLTDSVENDMQEHAPPEPREPEARELGASELYDQWSAHNAFTETFDCDSGWNKEGMIRFALAYSAELRAERDAAVEMLRVLMEETILAGYPGGDRNQTLANVRNMKRSLLQAREAIKLILGRIRNVPWSMVKESDVDGYLKEFNELASTSAPEGTTHPSNLEKA